MHPFSIFFIPPPKIPDDLGEATDHAGSAGFARVESACFWRNLAYK
jgi:hypothetical protein